MKTTNYSIREDQIDRLKRHYEETGEKIA